MMRVLIPLATALLLVVSTVAAADGNDRATFVIVRHAEKAADTGPDPALSVAGHARARALARSFIADDLVAVYATDYLRTRQTVQPTADAQGLDVTLYDARQPAEAFAAQLEARHRQGMVLIAGHSNTVPGIVSALCDCTAEEMPESEYDRLSIVHVAGDGSAQLQILRSGPAAPP